jgi:hypothetical protein
VGDILAVRLFVFSIIHVQPNSHSALPELANGKLFHIANRIRSIQLFEQATHLLLQACIDIRVSGSRIILRGLLKSRLIVAERLSGA